MSSDLGIANIKPAGGITHEKLANSILTNRSANKPNHIVAKDISGNFLDGIIVAITGLLTANRVRQNKWSPRIFSVGIAGPTTNNRSIDTKIVFLTGNSCIFSWYAADQEVERLSGKDDLEVYRRIFKNTTTLSNLNANNATLTVENR